MSSTQTSTINPLIALAAQGQSVWLDYIHRNLISSGELGRLIANDEIRGVTSNPAIFEKAIAGSPDYADTVNALRAENLDAMQIYERIAIKDIQDAADTLRTVYDRTERRDGYVSLEVSPYLARDCEGTIAEAHRLWRTVERDNLMIKVPATDEGILAIEQLIADGININVTLIFGLSQYERVVDAYIAGLEQRAAAGENVDCIASVASVFVSRVDTLADQAFDAINADPQAPRGQVAIANARLIYDAAQTRFSGSAWQALDRKGARPQRVLWASTGTKNPDYRDVMYIEDLIAPNTVNTVPPATLEAFRDHGIVRDPDHNVETARDILARIDQLGISIDEITTQLLDDGVDQFVRAFDQLLAACEA